MRYSNLFLIRGVAWTTGAFGFSQFCRLITSITLARLLAPELFGIMLIVNSIRTGIDLISDVGIGQNIVHNPNAENPEFYNTAWTLRLIRSVLLWLFCLAAAAPLARFYEAPIFLTVLPVAGVFFIIVALGSVAPYLAQKRMRFVRLTVYEVSVAIFSAMIGILLAYFIRTIWGLVLGALVAAAGEAVGSYFVLPNVRHRFHIAKEYAWQIFSFGRWIFISSIAYFLSMNFDRLYFGKIAALGFVGVYGIARSLSDLIGSLVLRLSYSLVFPLIAASHATPREQLRADLAIKRLSVLLLSAACFAALITLADIVIRVLYDQRYQAAGWMLPLLLLGAWFSMISNLNESTLLGFGKPSYSAVANGLKFAWLLVGFPLGFAQFGVLGVIVIVATGDLWRYVPILIGQARERFSFAGQDLIATLVMFGLVGVCEWLRWSLGLGTSFDGLLIAGTR
jgi:O-antigen/teichoic acid export membrane protein